MQDETAVLKQVMLDEGMHPEFVATAIYGSIPAAAEPYPIKINRKALSDAVESFVRHLMVFEEERVPLQKAVLDAVERSFPKSIGHNTYSINYKISSLILAAVTGHETYMGDTEIVRRNTAKAHLRFSGDHDSDSSNASRNRNFAALIQGDPADETAVTWRKTSTDAFGQLFASELWRHVGTARSAPSWEQATLMQRQPLVDIGRGLLGYIRHICEPKFPQPGAALGLPTGMTEFAPDAKDRNRPTQAEIRGHYPDWIADLNRQHALMLISKPACQELLRRISAQIPVAAVETREHTAQFLTSELNSQRRLAIMRRVAREIDKGVDQLVERLDALVSKLEQDPPAYRTAGAAANPDEITLIDFQRDVAQLTTAARRGGPTYLARLAGLLWPDERAEPIHQRLLTSGIFMRGSALQKVVESYMAAGLGEKRIYAGDKTDPLLTLSMRAALQEACSGIDLDEADEADSRYLLALVNAVEDQIHVGGRTSAIMAVRAIDRKISENPCCTALRARIARSPGFCKDIFDEAVSNRPHNVTRWLDLAEKIGADHVGLMLDQDQKINRRMEAMLIERPWLAESVARGRIENAATVLLMTEIAEDLSTRCLAIEPEEIGPRLFVGMSANTDAATMTIAWQGALAGLGDGLSCDQIIAGFRADMTQRPPEFSFALVEAEPECESLTI